MVSEANLKSNARQEFDTSLAKLKPIFAIPTIFNHSTKRKSCSNTGKRSRILRKKRINICCFSPFESVLAISIKDQCSVAIWSYEQQADPQQIISGPSIHSIKHTDRNSAQAHLLCIIRHSRPVQDLAWLEKHSSAHQGQTRILLTRTNDGISRIWTTTIDDMHSMHLTDIIPEEEKIQIEKDRRQEQLSKVNTNHRIFGKGVEDWDAIQEELVACTRVNVTSSNMHDTSQYSWHALRPETAGKEGEDIPVLALIHGRQLNVLSPQRLTFWQRSTLACNMIKMSYSLPKPPSPFNGLNLSRMGVIATTQFPENIKISDTDNDQGMIESIHWISDDHLLASLQKGQRALIIEAHTETKRRIVDNPSEYIKDERTEERKQEYEADLNKAQTISQIARSRSTALPYDHFEYLIRLVYWGQLSFALQVVYKTCRALQKRKNEDLNAQDLGEQDMIKLDDHTLRINTAPTERQLEVQRLIEDDEEQVKLKLKATEGEEGLRLLASNVVAKGWQKEEDHSHSALFARQASNTVANILLDLHQFVGQLDESAVRFVLNAISSNIYQDQSGKSFPSTFNLIPVSSGKAKSPSLAERPYTDSYLLKMSLHAWFSSTQEALLQYIETRFLIRLSERSAKVEDERIDKSVKLDWSIARRIGIFLWLRSNDQLRTLAEKIARVQYTAGDHNDPTACAMFYYALGKTKLLANLWRQAVWHPEYSKMMQFLKNDFTEPRWRTAAKKNAFALLSQRRFQMAAAFFLLGDSLQDAVNVCVRNLDDISLAVALCRIWHIDQIGQEVLKDLILQVILPAACSTQDRYTLLWVTEVMGKRDLSMMIIRSNDLISISREIAKAFGIVNVMGSDATCQTSLNQQDQRDADDLFFFKSIVPSDPINEGLLVNIATETLKQDGMPLLGKCLHRDWHFNDGKDELPIYSLFDSGSQQIKTIHLNKDINEIPKTSSSQPMKSEFVKQKPIVSAGDLEFNLDQWNM